MYNKLTKSQEDEVTNELIPRVQELFDNSSINFEEVEDVSMEFSGRTIARVCFKIGGQMVCFP